MTRVGILRTAHALLGLAFLALAATFTPAGGAFLPLGLAIGFAGGILFLVSREDLARWAGFVIVAYLVLCVIAFLAANGITIRAGDATYFANDDPSPVFVAIFEYLVIGIPLLLVTAAAVSVWDEGQARWLALASLAGFVLVGILTLVFTPDAPVDGAAASSAGLAILFAISALAAAGASFWASARVARAST